MNTPEQVYQRFRSMFTSDFTEEDFSNLLWRSDEDNMEELFDYLYTKLPYVEEFVYGASKLVAFLYGEPDWVLKFPLQGNATFVKNERGEYEADIEDEYVYAWGQDSDYEDYDYCAVELVVYETLPKDCRKLVTSIQEVGKIGYVHAYVSNRVSRNVYTCGRPSEDSTAKAREKVRSNEKYDIEAYFLANFYDAYGEELSNKLFDNLADLVKIGTVHRVQTLQDPAAYFLFFHYRLVGDVCHLPVSSFNIIHFSLLFGYGGYGDVVKPGFTTSPYPFSVILIPGSFSPYRNPYVLRHHHRVHIRLLHIRSDGSYPYRFHLRILLHQRPGCICRSE